MAPDEAEVARFVADLDRLIPSDQRIGVAVSGGPDSLSMLLLAAASRPDAVLAVTVDHALRPESRAEADYVARICSGLHVPHDVVTVDWGEKPESGIQERARDARYRLIADWMRARDLQAVCTAHHRDDQAETLLMRLVRGAGVNGLAAIRPKSPLPGSADLTLLRPLLYWRRSELSEICAAAGIQPTGDPSNLDPLFERVRIRKHIASLGLDPGTLARSADHLRDADEAIEWTVDRHWSERVGQADRGMTYDPGDAPSEIRRRIVARIITMLATEGAPDLRGRELDRVIDMLEAGGAATLRGVAAEGGGNWRFMPAPPRQQTYRS